MSIKKSLHKDLLEFNSGKKRYKWILWNNLPKTHGLSLSDALINWSERTDEFTIESFCSYINDKQSGHYCFTEKQYGQL